MSNVSLLPINLKKIWPQFSFSPKIQSSSHNSLERRLHSSLKPKEWEHSEFNKCFWKNYCFSTSPETMCHHLKILQCYFTWIHTLIIYAATLIHYSNQHVVKMSREVTNPNDHPWLENAFFKNFNIVVGHLKDYHWRRRDDLLVGWRSIGVFNHPLWWKFLRTVGFLDNLMPLIQWHWDAPTFVFNLFIYDIALYHGSWTLSISSVLSLHDCIRINENASCMPWYSNTNDH